MLDVSDMSQDFLEFFPSPLKHIVLPTFVLLYIVHIVLSTYQQL